MRCYINKSDERDATHDAHHHHTQRAAGVLHDPKTNDPFRFLTTLRGCARQATPHLSFSNSKRFEVDSSEALLFNNVKAEAGERNQRSA